jgi:hypothetical protein
VIPIENIHENDKVMVILEIQGVKSSSNFQVDIEVKQLMVLKPEELFDTFILKNNNSLANPVKIEPSHPVHEPEPFTDEPTSLIEDEPISQDPLVVINTTEDSLCEVDFDLDKLPTEGDSVVCLKERKEMYYQMYQEARQKAKVARDLALSAYLEANQIKNKYMLDDILDSSSDESEDEGSETETF